MLKEVDHPPGVRPKIGQGERCWIGSAFKQMSSRVRMEIAIRADVIGSTADLMLVRP